MKENQKMCNCKAMKMTFYTQTTQYNGGRKNIDFKFIDHRTEIKRMKKKIYKRRHAYLITRSLLQTLNSYMEASKCKTLENFTKEVKTW